MPDIEQSKLVSQRKSRIVRHMKYLSLLLLPLALLAKQPESYYQNLFAAKVGGQTEVTAGDGTRYDILTDTHAIEVDFARKWGEAIGQSLNYGFQFNRKAGILIILEKPSDRKHLIRINSIIRHYNLPIDVWDVSAEVEAGSIAPTNQVTTSGDYWVSSTGKTHRQGCRYYGKGNGQYVKKESGDNCKICGGTK